MLAAGPGAVRETPARASRGRSTAGAIENPIDRAGESIGVARAELALNEELCSSLDLIAHLEEQIGHLDQQIAGLMDERPSPLLPLGLGTSLAAALHAESDPAGDFPTARQCAAYAGLEPTTFEPGQMKGSNAHISKRGSPHLRRALCLPAFVAFRKHDYFARPCNRFRRKGRGHQGALAAVARRLALAAWRLLVDNRESTKRPPPK